MTHNSEPSIGVAVITHHAKHHLAFCLPQFLLSSLKPKVLVVNSSSHDGTVELAQKMGADTLVIPRSEFNHGTTREKARQHLQTDILVMITPDAYALDKRVLERLIKPIVKGYASASYARQIPHNGAGFFESFPREFNYPEGSHIRGIEDASSYGVYTVFCSNSCAAYKNSALDEIGGFKPVLLGEDTFAVAALLNKGHKIAYVAEAIVKHSHRYSLVQEFKRSFDTGLARKEHHHIIRQFGTDEKRGKAYFYMMSKRLLQKKPLFIPYAFLQTLCKWLGYRIGRASTRAPIWWKRAFSSQDFYWSSLSTQELGDHHKSKETSPQS